jgi:hypothetical protein
VKTTVPARRDRKVKKGTLTAGVILFACIGVSAGAAEWPKVEARKAGQVVYLNGGFGIEERSVIPGGYSLKLVFATDKGNYLSGVAVTVAGSDGGTVAEIAANDGPWLLVALKPGTYQVTGLHNGKKRSATATVPANGNVTVLLSWKTSEVDMGLAE